MAGSGRAGSRRSRRVLTSLVAPLARGDSSFADEVPRVDAAGTFWLEPELVVDVETHGLGTPVCDSSSYRGVRSDLTPEDL